MNAHLPPGDAQHSRRQALRPRAALRRNEYRRFHPQAVEALIEVDGEIDAAARRIEEASHERTQARLQAETLVTERIAEFSARNRQILSEIARLDAQRSEVVAQRDRQVLRAPVDSVVNQLRVAGPGVNVIAEEHLMTLVPLDDHVIVEAMVANSAIAFVEVGQTALLKLDALPFQRYGTVPGEVIPVGATSIEASPGDWRYPVRIALLHEETETSAGQPVSLRPGMTLRADIITEERSLASYFLDAVTSAVSEGMVER